MDGPSSPSNVNDEEPQERAGKRLNNGDTAQPEDAAQTEDGTARAPGSKPVKITKKGIAWFCVCIFLILVDVITDAITAYQFWVADEKKYLFATLVFIIGPGIWLSATGANWYSNDSKDENLPTASTRTRVVRIIFLCLLMGPVLRWALILFRVRFYHFYE